MHCTYTVCTKMHYESTCWLLNKLNNGWNNVKNVKKEKYRKPDCSICLTSHLQSKKRTSKWCPFLHTRSFYFILLFVLNNSLTLKTTLWKSQDLCNLDFMPRLNSYFVPMIIWARCKPKDCLAELIKIDIFIANH